MHYRELLSAIAIGLTFLAYLPYLRDILRDKTKPHVFSWITWGSTTIIAFFAQLEADGGAGAWPIGVSGSITLVVAALAYIKRADTGITRLDWIFFVSAMSSLRAWYLTSNPAWAAIVLTVVDVLGFGPTLRKIQSHPHSESIPFFALFAVRNALVVMALESYSVATVLFPAGVGAACALVVCFITYRRRVMVHASAVTVQVESERG